MNDSTTFEPAKPSNMETTRTEKDNDLDHDLDHDLDLDHDAVETTIDIAASPERVFAALTDPQELAAWWGSDDTYRTHDWHVDARPDGEWSARTIDPSGKEGSIRGKFAVVDRPGVLESTWRASWDEIGTTTVRYDLSPAIVHDAPGTRLTVTHTSFNGFTACAGMRGAAYATALGAVIETLGRSRHVRRVLMCAA
jgi:uncharacterized protein YndB with AHSA1/START domain